MLNHYFPPVSAVCPLVITDRNVGVVPRGNPLAQGSVGVIAKGHIPKTVGLGPSRRDAGEEQRRNGNRNKPSHSLSPNKMQFELIRTYTNGMRRVNRIDSLIGAQVQKNFGVVSKRR